jgi:hypothetical protein
MEEDLSEIDVTNQPELLRIAEEVHASQEPRVLRRNHQDLAIVTPVRPTSARQSRGRRLDQHDALLSIVGLAGTLEGEPADVSSNKHTYLAEAYAEHGQ